MPYQTNPLYIKHLYLYQIPTINNNNYYIWRLLWPKANGLDILLNMFKIFLYRKTNHNINNNLT